ncbi:hypothetical protein [Terricaulis sp.]|uniref:hypothetical protein n=1 Tax=Terricaulis sp. TaxID=2768686 RepID=UPI002AC66A5E|nr:hypothetical protein [Terricaulis sp.]MDZ4690738.1 hypothetical protein [Terricaulis sp.]
MTQSEAGRGSALIVYALYLLSIPSLAIFALVGVIFAYAARDGAGPLARSHLDDQIRIWWVAFWWAVAVAILFALGALLAVVLIGFPIMWIAGLIGFIFFVWFTVKALLGLLALLDGRPR